MMSLRRGMVVALVLLLVSVGMAACAAPAAPPKPAEPSAAKPAVSEALKKVIEAARQEKEVFFQKAAGAGITEIETARRMEELVKKYFDVNVSIKMDGAPTMPATTQKLIMEAKAGAPASYDLVYQVENTILALYSEGLLEKVDWVGLFPWIKKEDILFDNWGIIPASQYVLPGYNTNLVSKAELPKKWMDLADPKWKGKMIAPVYQTGLTRLAQADTMGEAKAQELVNKLATQGMAFGRYPDLHTRMIAGEFSLNLLQLAFYYVDAQRKNAPVAEIYMEDGALIFEDVVGIPKHAKHPNAAKLVAAVILTDEGQQLWWEGDGRSSIHRPGTYVSEWAKGKKVYFPDMNFLLRDNERLDKQFTDILIKK